MDPFDKELEVEDALAREIEPQPEQTDNGPREADGDQPPNNMQGSVLRPDLVDEP